MSHEIKFNILQARNIGDQLGVDWDRISIDQFTMGLNVELEHGSFFPETNITNDDPLITGKIAWAHLIEIPDYYTRLQRMEEEAMVFYQD